MDGYRQREEFYDYYLNKKPVHVVFSDELIEAEKIKVDSYCDYYILKALAFRKLDKDGIKQTYEDTPMELFKVVKQFKDNNTIYNDIPEKILNIGLDILEEKGFSYDVSSLKKLSANELLSFMDDRIKQNDYSFEKNEAQISLENN
jgi:hypothetical protein